MLRHRNESSHCLLEIEVAVDILFVQLLQHGLFQLGAADIAESQRQENAGESGGVFPVEGLDPFDGDGGDDGMEGVVNDEVVFADLVEEIRDVMVGEQFKVALSEPKVTLISAARTLQVGDR